MEFPFHQPSARERQKDRTRERLFDAAVEEFRREGFDRASVATIARRAGVSRPSFYFHFPTKEHVLLALQWNLELAVVERLKGRDRLPDAMREFVESLIDAEASFGDPLLFRDMLRIYARRPEGLALEEQPFPLVLELGRRFSAGARDGELRKGVDPDQATHLFLTSVFGYLIVTIGRADSHRADLEVLMGLFLQEAGA